MAVAETLLFEVENVSLRTRAAPQIEQDIADQMGIATRLRFLRDEVDARALIPVGWEIVRLEPDGFGKIYCQMKPIGATAPKPHVEGGGPDRESAIVSARLSLELYGDRA